MTDEQTELAKRADAVAAVAAARVFRGGSWGVGPLFARVAGRRISFTPGIRLYFLGVRLVEVIEEANG